MATTYVTTETYDAYQNAKAAYKETKAAYKQAKAAYKAASAAARLLYLIRESRSAKRPEGYADAESAYYDR